MGDADDMSAEERRAVLVWRLYAGERFTTRQVAEALGIRYNSAHRYLCRISRVLAIYYDDPEDYGGPRWQRV